MLHSNEISTSLSTDSGTQVLYKSEERSPILQRHGFCIYIFVFKVSLRTITRQVSQAVIITLQGV